MLASGSVFAVFASVAPPDGFNLDDTAPIVREVVTDWFRRRGGHLRASQFVDPERRRWEYADEPRRVAWLDNWRYASRLAARSRPPRRRGKPPSEIEVIHARSKLCPRRSPADRGRRRVARAGSRLGPVQDRTGRRVARRKGLDRASHRVGRPGLRRRLELRHHDALGARRCVCRQGHPDRRGSGRVRTADDSAARPTTMRPPVPTGGIWKTTC